MSIPAQARSVTPSKVATSMISPHGAAKESRWRWSSAALQCSAVYATVKDPGRVTHRCGETWARVNGWALLSIS